MDISIKPISRTGIVKVAAASFIGTLIEYFDFFLFGTAAALVFNKIFFPNLNALTGTLASFAVFGAAFIARPLGGIVFGHFGDRLGRKTMLVLSLSIVGISTAMVGLLPTYHQVGGLITSGPVPFVAAALYASTGASWPLALYIMVGGVLSLIAVAAARETYRENIATVTGDPGSSWNSRQDATLGSGVSIDSAR